MQSGSWGLFYSCFCLYIFTCDGFNIRIARSANATTTRPIPVTFPRPGILDTRYVPPPEITWIDLGFDPNFDASNRIPPTLNALPGCRSGNPAFSSQMQSSLSADSAAVRNALDDPAVLSTVSGTDFSSMSNNVMSACTSDFIAQMTRNQHSAAARSPMIGVMGLINLIQFQTSNFLPGTNSPLDRTSPVKCSVLMSRLRDPTKDDRIVTYKGMLELDLDTLRNLKPYITGLTVTMARSVNLATYDNEREQKTAIVIDAFNGDEWAENVAICSSLFLAVTTNINSQPGNWNPTGFNDLQNKIVPMFECLKPAYIESFRTEDLWDMVDELSPLDFSWQRGSAIVRKIFGEGLEQIYDNQFFVRLNGLNKFLTVDLLQNLAVKPNMRDTLLSRASLSRISQFTKDPLLLEWLYSELRRDRYPGDLRQYTTSDDVHTIATLVTAMTVADIRRFDPQAVFQNIIAFQVQGLRPGQAFALAFTYLETRGSDTPLNTADLANLRTLLPTVDYKEIERIRVDDIQQNINILKELSDRVDNEHPLTAAQKHLIAAKLTVSSSNSIPTMITSTLGPQLSMELSPSVYFNDLQSLSNLGLSEQNGMLLDPGMVLQNNWTPFQRTVFYQLYLREMGENVRLSERMFYSLGSLASGITTTDIYSADYTNIIGITNAVMTHGGDMNKAWLLSIQIRRAFASMHGLQSIDQFSLGLLGTANLAALDSLTLRMFSVKEMEDLNAADCRDVISKIGNRRDVYLIPFPKRQEIVCFYVQRCRFVPAQGGRYVVADSQSILANYQHTDPRAKTGGRKYYRKVNDYCESINPVALTNEDLDILGNLVCDIPAVLLRQEGFPVDMLWMFHGCKSLDLEQGAAIFSHLRDQKLYTTRDTIAQLAHSLCNIIPPGIAQGMISERYRKEIIDFVQYAYDRGFKAQKDYGLTKKHLNENLFWYREVSKQQQENIQACFMYMSRNALNFFRDYEKTMFLNQVVVYDERLSLNPNPIVLRPVFQPTGADYQDFYNDGGNEYNGGGNYNGNGNDNYDTYDDVDYVPIATLAPPEDNTVNKRQKREYFDFFQERILCPEVHVLGFGNRIWSLRDLEWMSPEELSRCISFFGQNYNLTFQQRTTLKDKVNMLVGGWENISPEYLIQIESLAMTMQEYELRRLKLDDMQINFFLAQWPWEKWQRQVLFENVRRRFDFYPSSMDSFDFKALGELVCGMRPSDIARIYTETYYEIALFFGQLTTCDHNQWRMLLAKAKSAAAFGPIGQWTDSHVIAVGSVIAGMEVGELDTLTPSKNPRGANLVAAIPPHVFPMIPVHILKKLRVEFFQAMTVEQVIALTPHQWAWMNNGQASAAMDIWFGFDNWPQSYLSNLQQSHAQSIISNIGLICGLLLYILGYIGL